MKTLTLGLAVGALALLVANGAARDLKTTTGETFHNISVTQIQPLGIRITHDDGAGFYYFMQLTEADRSEFGYDPAAYAAAYGQLLVQEQRLAEQRALLARRAAIAATLAQVAADDAAPAVPMLSFGPAPTGYRTSSSQLNTAGGASDFGDVVVAPAVLAPFPALRVVGGRLHFDGGRTHSAAALRTMGGSRFRTPMMMGSGFHAR